MISQHIGFWPLKLYKCLYEQLEVWRRQWHPTPVLLPRKSHGWRSLVGCSPWGGEELNTTERLHFHFLLSCIGEGNGNPLQCSCLENPRDRGAWWTAICEVAQSRTRLKRLSSSSMWDECNCVVVWAFFGIAFLSTCKHLVNSICCCNNHSPLKWTF